MVLASVPRTLPPFGGLQLLPQACKQWQDVAAMVKAGVPTASLLSLERVYNSCQWRRYDAELQNFADLGVGPNEALLWHGTRGSDPRDIAMQPNGLDLRVSVRDKLLYGRALYFADTPLYSCHFGHVVEEEDSGTSGSEVALEGGGVGEEGGGDTAPTGSKGCAKASGGRCRRMQRSTVQMLLCRTQLGRVCDMGTAVNPALTRAPQGFDSVSGRTDAAGGTRMWALYSNAHCYTAYVVTLSLCVPCSVLPASVSCCRRPGAM